jgi:hypothetical protein
MVKLTKTHIYGAIMKKLKNILLILLSAVILTSCFPDTNEDPNPDPDWLGSNQNDDDGSLFYRLHNVGMNGGIKNWQEGGIDYSGEEVVLNYHITPIFDTEFGVMVLTDGVLQPVTIRIDGQIVAENVTLYKIDIPGRETADFDICFHPIAGNAGDTVFSAVISMPWPSFGPTNDSYIGYGNVHRAMGNPVQINIKAKPPASSFTAFKNVSAEPLTESVLREIGKTYETLYMDGTIREVDIRDKKEFSRINDRLAGNGKIRLYFRAYGGENITFRTTFFINHMPVKIENADFAEYTLVKGEYIEFSVELDLNALLGSERYATFYTVTLPVGQDAFKEFSNLTNCKTMSTLLVNERIPRDPNEKPVPGFRHPGADSVEDEPPLDVPPPDRLPEITSINNVVYDIIEILHVGNDRLLVTSKPPDLFGEARFTVLDKNTLEIIGRTDFINGMSFGKISTGITPLKNGGYALPILLGDNSGVMFFDSELKLTEKIDIREILGNSAGNDRWLLNANISSDGNKIAVATGGGEPYELIIYDRNTKTTEIIASNKTLGFIIIQIKFCDNDNKIVFTGSNNMFGIIDLNTKEIISHKESRIDSNRIQITENFAFWDDDQFFIAMGENASGKARMIDFSTNALTEFKFEDINESQNAYISPDGKRIVSITLNRSNDPTSFKVYDRATGNVTKTFAYEGGRAMPIDVSISPDSKSLIVVYDSGVVVEYSLD